MHKYLRVRSLHVTIDLQGKTNVIHLGWVKCLLLQYNTALP